MAIDYFHTAMNMICQFVLFHSWFEANTISFDIELLIDISFARNTIVWKWFMIEIISLLRLFNQTFQTMRHVIYKMKFNAFSTRFGISFVYPTFKRCFMLD